MPEGIHNQNLGKATKLIKAYAELVGQTIGMDIQNLRDVKEVFRETVFKSNVSCQTSLQKE